MKSYEQQPLYSYQNQWLALIKLEKAKAHNDLLYGSSATSLFPLSIERLNNNVY